jgi:F0F1-type ATP synthase assembly protein I
MAKFATYVGWAFMLAVAGLLIGYGMGWLLDNAPLWDV